MGYRMGRSQDMAFTRYQSNARNLCGSRFIPVILPLGGLRHGALNFYYSKLRIFGSKRDVNGKLKKLHNGELHSLYHSTNIVRVIKSRRLNSADHVTFKIVTGKPTEKIPLGRPRPKKERQH